MKKLLPPAAFLIALCVSIIAHVLSPGWVVLTPPLSLLGVPILVLGLYLPIAGSMLFSKRQTNINTFLPPDQLVTSGLFSFTRNPMYLGFTLALFGVWVITGNLAGGVGAISFFLLANYWYIPFEETRCKAVFGDEYADYCARVGRWF